MKRPTREQIAESYKQSHSYRKSAAELGISPSAVRYQVNKSSTFAPMYRSPGGSAPIDAISTPTPKGNFDKQSMGLLGVSIPSGVPLNIESGVPGLRHWFGRISEEWIPELSDERGKRTYIEMASNDSTIGAVLYAIEMLIRQAPWMVEPVDQSEAEMERADFLWSCINDMYVPWTESLSEMLSVATFGFFLGEMVFKIRKGKSGEVHSAYDDGKIGIHKLAPRAQETIYRWLMDDKGEVLGVVQWAPPNWQQSTIGIDRLLHLKLHGRRGNPEGTSCLRSAFRSWDFLKRIEEYEAIGIERDLCGLPLIELSDEIMALAQGDATTPRATNARTMLTSMQQLATRIKKNEQGGLVFPMGFDENSNPRYKFSLVNSAGTRTIDTNSVITRLKQQIAVCVLADFILLGHEKVGSFSLASSKTDIFSLAVAGIMDTICGGINQKLVPLLFEANGESGPFPELRHGDLETPDLDGLGKYLGALTTAGINLLDGESGDAVKRYLLRAADLPTDME